MPIDYSKLSTSDLLALKSGDLSKVSTAGLQAIKSQSQKSQPPSSSLPKITATDMLELSNPLTSIGKSIDLMTGSDLTGRQKEAAQGVAQGGIDLGEGAYNLANRGLHYFLPKVVPLHTLHDDINQSPKYPLFYNFGRMVPSFAAPEVKGASFLSRVPRAGKYLTPVGNAATTGATYGAIYGANNDNSSLARDMVLGGSLGGASHLGLNSLKHPANFLIRGLRKESQEPGSVVKTPQEAQALLDQDLGNVPVSLGDFINSPNLRSRSNFIANLPFSGSRTNFNKAVYDFNNQGDNVFQGLLGSHSIGGVKKEIAKAIRSNYKDRSDQASKLYSEAIEHGDQKGFNLGTPNSLIEHPIEFLTQNNPVNKQLKQQIEDVLNGEADLASSHAVKSHISQKMRDAAINPDKQNEARIYAHMRDALDSDMNNAMDPETQALYSKANNYFKNEVAPYRDNRNVFNAAKGRVDNPKTLSNDLIDAQTESTRKVLTDLPQDKKNLILLDRLQNHIAEDYKDDPTVDPTRLWSAYSKKLPEDAKGNLLTDQMRNEFRKLGALEDITRNSRVQQNPPLTGYQNRNVLMHSPAYIISGMGLFHNPIDTLSALSTILGGNRFLDKALRSKRLKEAYVQGGLNRVTNPESFLGRSSDYLSTGRQIAPIYAAANTMDNKR